MNLAVYLTGMMIFVIGFYFMRKNERVWNGICSIFLSYIVWMLAQALIYFMNIALRSRVVAWQYGVWGCLIGSYFWYRVLKEKKIQKYLYSWADMLIVVILLLFTLGWGRYQFGAGLEKFNYISVYDSSIHLSFARDMLTKYLSSDKMAGQWFAAINSAVWMSALEGIVPGFYQYKIFICTDLLVLFLNGMIFWTAARRYLKTRILEAIGMILTFLYLLGHPLNSLVYGTAYFNRAMMLCIVIYHFAMLLLEKEIDRKLGSILLLSAMADLLFSYKLFVPVFACGVLIYIYYVVRIQHGKMDAKQIRISCIVWAILIGAGVFCYYSFVSNLRLEADMSWAMYGHLYADYLFPFPFLVWLLQKNWRKKKLGMEEFLLLLCFAFVLVMFFGVCGNVVSVYYFFKTYAILWGMVFLSVVKCISTVIEKKRQCMFVLVFWIALFVVNGTGLERVCLSWNILLEKSTEVSLFPIYRANLTLQENLKDRRGLEDMLMEAAKMSWDEDISIPYISISASVKDDIDQRDQNLQERDAYVMWGKYKTRYHALLGSKNQWEDAYDGEPTVEQLQKDGYKYVLLISRYRGKAAIRRYCSSLKSVRVIREDDYGCLVALQPQE